MAAPKIRKKVRAPLTEDVFRSFVDALRKDPLFSSDACDRLYSALTSEVTITPGTLREALFHETSDADKDRAA